MKVPIILKRNGWTNWEQQQDRKCKITPNRSRRAEENNKLNNTVVGFSVTECVEQKKVSWKTEHWKPQTAAKETRILKSEGSWKDLGVKIKLNNIYITVVPEGEEGEKRVENFPKK